MVANFTQYRESAQRHGDFFCDLINRFPAHLVLPRTEQEEETAAARFFKHRKQALPKDEKKKMAKEGKRARFDPENQKTVTELQKEHKVTRSSKTTTADDDASSSASNSDTDDVRSEAPRPNDEGEEAVEETIEHNSINALRARLHKHISESRKKRARAEGKPEKRKRAHKHDKEKGRSSGKDVTHASGNKRKGEEASPAQELLEKKTDDPKAQVQDHGDIQFAMLQLTQKDDSKRNRVPAPGSKKAKLQNLIERAQEKEKRLEELKHSKHEGDKDKAKSIQWNDTFKTASGDKVEHASKLKQALKKRESKKEKSRSKWTSIKDGEMQARQKKQEKREANLKSRGRNNGAGFEGKKIGFLNNDTRKET